MAGEDQLAHTYVVFGDYEIIETIGQGGMGVVYRAHDTKLGRIVALKVLREDLRTEESLVARFQREAEAFATLNHPNIVHIYSVGKVGDIPYIAMEYVEGLPLNKVMRNERRIPWKRALDITQQIASALACAHAAHIIHRDIKPGNILLDSEGKAYVTDFGIAKVLTADTQLTMEGSRLGTPEYMSPERCKNEEITAASDIYSTGILLFQMISGRLPHEASTSVELIRKIIAEPPTRLNQFVPDVPQNVERLVAYMIEKKPQNRPPNCDRLIASIERVRAGKALREDDDAMSKAYDALRQETGAGARKKPLAPRFVTKITDALAAAWGGIPAWGQSLIIAAAVILLCGMAGRAVAGYLSRGFALHTLERPNVSAAPWDASSSVGVATQEAPGIRLYAINLPAFDVGHAAWRGSREAVVQLDGIQNSARESQRALVQLHAATFRSALWVPPISPPATNPNVPPIGLLDGGATHVLYRQFTYDAVLDRPFDALKLGPGTASTTSATRTLARFDTGADRSGRASVYIQRIGPGALHPSGETAAIALRQDESPASWVLVERDTSRAETVDGHLPLTSSGREFTSVQYALSGEQLAYVRSVNKDESELWVVASGGNLLDGVPIARGRLAVSRSAFSPDGDRICYAIEEDGASAVHTEDVSAHGDVFEYGAGEFAAWHPSGDYLLAVADDRRDNRQLWRIAFDNPEERTQLTFFEGGIEPVCMISIGGQRILTALAGRASPTVVVIDLLALEAGPS